MSEILWGDLRSALHQPTIATRAQWLDVVEQVRRFPDGEERESAARYAGQRIHDAPESWPPEVCSLGKGPRTDDPDIELWSGHLIKSLKLSSVSDEHIARFQEFLDTPNLRLKHLRLQSSGELTTPALHSLLGDCDALKTLSSFTFQGDAPATIAPVLDQASWLEQLDAFRVFSWLDEDVTTASALIARCSQLDHLSISCDTSETGSWRTLTDAIPGTVKSLGLSGGKFSAETFRDFDSRHIFDAIERLFLSSWTFGASGLKELSKIELPSVHALSLGSSIGGAGITAMMTATWAESITALDLTQNELKPFGKSIDTLANHGFFERLEKLSLASANLRKGAYSKLFKQRFPNLKLFNLSGNNHTLHASNVKQLATCHMPQIEELYLSGNGLESEQLLPLLDADWPNLRVLYIRAPHDWSTNKDDFDPEIMSQFEQKWPDAYILGKGSTKGLTDHGGMNPWSSML